uniref:Uncharacterized protein n=1 Tax=Glossina pallidipes TaxID=7398 RepID=A0A1A9ZT46_GLOPL
MKSLCQRKILSISTPFDSPQCDQQQTCIFSQDENRTYSFMAYKPIQKENRICTRVYPSHTLYCNQMRISRKTLSALIGLFEYFLSSTAFLLLANCTVCAGITK